MAFFKVPHAPEFSVHYEIVPNILPRTTLFVHGNLASNRWWYPSRDLWQKQAAGQKCAGSMILAEFRGCGKSTPPRSETDVSMAAFAQDFLALIEHLRPEIGGEKINLVGHSTGGLVVSLMAAARPEMFHKILLLDPVGARGVTFDPSMTEAFEQMKRDRNLTALVIGSTIKDNNPEAQFFKEALVEDAFQSVNHVGAWVLKALDGLDVRSTVAKVRSPSLVLHGEFDQLLPVQDSKDLATLMAGQFQTLEGRGHCGNIENPTQFVATAQKFLF